MRLYIMGNQFGISDTQLRRAYPGFKTPELTQTLAKFAKDVPGSLNELAAALDDHRPTAITEKDWFNNKAPECSDLAQNLLMWLVPLRGEEASQIDFKEQAKQWAEHTRDMSPKERVSQFLENASEQHFRLFLGFFLALGFDDAWPAIEKRFLKRAANNPDDYLVLEISAYLRCRKTAAADFWKKLTDQAEKKFLVRTKEIIPQRNGSPLIVQDETLDAPIDRWLAGKDELKWVDQLAMSRIDQPWAYHSMGVEPPAAYLPNAESNLVTLLQGTLRATSPEQRQSLLRIASGHAEILNSIIGRSDREMLAPRPFPTDSKAEPLTKPLHELLKGYASSNDIEKSNAVSAARIVWTLWGPHSAQTTIHTSEQFNDWRDPYISDPEIVVGAASEILELSKPFPIQEFPADAANKLSIRFATGNAEELRTQMAQLRWDEKLMLDEQGRKDRDFAAHVWPIMLNWVSWDGAGKVPDTFTEVWKQHCAGKDLSNTSVDALVKWLIDEARSNRYWTIEANSQVYDPGLNVQIKPSVVLKNLEGEIETADGPQRTPSKHPKLWINVSGIKNGSIEEFELVDGTLRKLADSPGTGVIGKISSDIPTNFQGEIWVRDVELELRFLPKVIQSK